MTDSEIDRKLLNIKNIHDEELEQLLDALIKRAEERLQARLKKLREKSKLKIYDSAMELINE